MPLLKDAKACYVGTTPITAIMADDVQVWPYNPPETVATWPLNKDNNNYSGTADSFNNGNSEFSNESGRWLPGCLPANARPNNGTSAGSYFTQTFFNQTLETWTIEQWFQWNSELLGQGSGGGAGARQTQYILGHGNSNVPSSLAGLSAQRVEPPATLLGKPCFNFWDHCRGPLQMNDGDGAYYISNFAVGTKVHVAITCPGPNQYQTIWINGKNCGYLTTDGTTPSTTEYIDHYFYYDQQPVGLIEDMSLMSDVRVTKGVLYTQNFDVPDMPFEMHFYDVGVYLTAPNPPSPRQIYYGTFTAAFDEIYDDQFPTLTDQEAYDLFDIEAGSIKLDTWSTVGFSSCEFTHEHPSCKISFPVGVRDSSSGTDSKSDFRFKLKVSERWITVNSSS